MIGNITKDIKSKSFLGRKFIGKVVDNNDPKKIGRVKVQIPHLTSDFDKDELPWYLTLQPLFLGGSSRSSFFSVPEENSNVLVEFLTDDVYNGLVMGVIQTEFTHSEKKYEAFEQDYPNVYGFVDSVGNLFRINKKTETIEFETSSGVRHKTDKNGNYELTVPGNIDILSKKKMRILADDGLYMKSKSGDIVLHANKDLSLGSDSGDIIEEAKMGNINTKASMVIKRTAGSDIIDFGSTIQLNSYDGGPRQSKKVSERVYTKNEAGKKSYNRSDQTTNLNNNSYEGDVKDTLPVGQKDLSFKKNSDIKKDMGKSK